MVSDTTNGRSYVVDDGTCYLMCVCLSLSICRHTVYLSVFLCVSDCVPLSYRAWHLCLVYLCLIYGYLFVSVILPFTSFLHMHIPSFLNTSFHLFLCLPLTYTFSIPFPLSYPSISAPTLPSSPFTLSSPSNERIIFYAQQLS